jgi:hypothetical protein
MITNLFFFKQGQTFSTFNLDAHISDVRQLEKIWESQPALSNALTFFHARETSYFFMLNKQTCEVRIIFIANVPQAKVFFLIFILR